MLFILYYILSGVGLQWKSFYTLCSHLTSGTYQSSSQQMRTFMLSWLCSGISGSQLQIRHWSLNFQKSTYFSIQHLQWVPWKPCHDAGTTGILRQTLLLTEWRPIFLRWPKFETNRNGSRPYLLPSLSLGSALGPSCHTPSSTVCDMITVDLHSLLGTELNTLGP